MSKSSSFHWDNSDPVPSYEESISSSSHSAGITQPQPLAEKSTSKPTPPVHLMIREERTRRIQNLITSTLLPCFTSHLINAVANLTIVVVPTGSLPSTSVPIGARNVVTPSFQNLSTTGAVVCMSGEDNGACFWTQKPVAQELDSLLRRELTGGTSEQDPIWDRREQKSQSQYQFISQPSLSLPARTEKKSWFKRAIPQVPNSERDPTGETGKWDLGWRSPQPEDVDQRMAGEKRSRALNPDEVDVHTKFQDVSFRTESEMGLLEATTVKCIWINIEVGV